MFRLKRLSRRPLSRRNGKRMTPIFKPSGPLAVRFWLYFRFFADLKACWASARCPLTPARRFSAWFGHMCRRPQLLQNRWHDPTRLSRGDEVTAPFPRTIAGLPKGASQHQLVHGRCHYHTPALKLLCRAQMHFLPEQVLLEKAGGILVRKAPLVTVHDFFQRQGPRSGPNEPALARITPGSFGSQTQYSIGRQFYFPCLPHVQVVPGLDLDRLAALIGALPRAIRLPPRLWFASVKQVAILAWGSSFARKGSGALR